MATLEKIRGKAGLLVIVIGVALLAFIVGDFLNSGHTFFMMNKNKVAEVNGTKITTEEFQQRVKSRTEELQQMYAQRGMTLPEGSTSRINKEVFDQMVNELVLNDEIEKLGMTVTKEELFDLLQGENISPMVRQYFTNPQTGQFDRQALNNFVQVILDPQAHGYTAENMAQIEPQRQMWLSLEKQVKENRAIEKFAKLITKAIAPNNLDIESSFEDGKVRADIVYAVQSYNTVSDSAIVISDSELKAAYNKDKKRFETPERRSLKYITVDIVPGKADFAKVKEKFDMVQEQFATSADVADVVNNNSDIPYSDIFVSERALTPDVRKFVETAQINAVNGPVFENNTYTMYRLMASKVAPDSVKVRLLSFPIAVAGAKNTQLDSAMNVLKNGGDFEALAKKLGAGEEGIWITENMAPSVGKAFIKAVFGEQGNGYFQTESLSGSHIVQVLERTAPVKKYKVAELSMAVNPSTETYTDLYNGLSSYIAKNNDAKSFSESAKESSFSVMDMEVTPESYSLPGIEDARQAIRWAFNAGKGDVSEIYTVGDKFLVVALDKVTKKGYAPLDEVKDYVKAQLMNDKKAEMIMKELAAKNATTLEAYAQAMNSKVDTAKFISFSSPSIAGVGYEPVLSALAPYADNGKLQGPAKGNRGVYVFSVFNKNVSAQPFNPAVESQKLEQSYMYSINSQLLNVLRDKADIEDTLIKFF